MLSLRGSRTLSTWIANMNFSLTNASSLCQGCEVHAGFWQSWQTVADTMKSQIDSALKVYPGYTLVLTGHSFGAAVATLGGTALRNAGYQLDLVSLRSLVLCRRVCACIGKCSNSRNMAVYLRRATSGQRSAGHLYHEPGASLACDAQRRRCPEAAAYELWV